MSLRPLLLFIGGVARVAYSSRAHADVDDVVVMLTVRGFTKTNSGNVAVPQAIQYGKYEALGMIAEDLKEVDQLLWGVAPVQNEARHAGPPATNMTNIQAQETSSSRGGYGVAWVLVTCAVLVAAVCIYCCVPLSLIMKQKNLHKEEEFESPYGVTEIWTKKVLNPEEYLTNLFDELDDIEQSDDSPPGFISYVDLENAMCNKELLDKLARVGIGVFDCEAVFAELDVTGSGLVTNEEFIKGCLQRGAAHHKAHELSKLQIRNLHL